MRIPALYDCVVGHSRHTTVKRAFRHRLYTWLVDLDEPPRFPWWLQPFVRFEARDHLGSPDRSIRQNIEGWLAAQGVRLTGGRILMLAHARVLGYVFNPVSVFWCYRPDGDLECVVAEVHNTYRERHCYLLRPDERGIAEVDKQFYVSPFLPLDGSYTMRITPPGDRVDLRIDLHDGQRTLFSAALSGRRLPATRSHLVRMVLRRPLVPQRVSALIRRHGIALWLRRVPIVPRKPHGHQEAIHD
ncbi:MAG: DUF1365 domain-containing protein [Haloechinothrix sp.]